MSDPVAEVMALADSYGDLLMRWNSTTADEVADARAALESRVRELVNAEREACALEALQHTTHADDPSNEVWQCAYNHVASEIAAAIRATGDAQARTQEGETP